MELANEKLYLSKFKRNNICDEYLSWLNDKRLMKYSRHRHSIHNYFSCLKYLGSFKNTDNLFLIINSPGNKMIGTMTAYIDIKKSIADIGILIGNISFNKKGYGLSAWCLLQDYLIKEKKINKITAGTLAENIGMIKIMEKSGMIFQYKSSVHSKIDKKFYNELYYAKFAK